MARDEKNRTGSKRPQLGTTVPMPSCSTSVLSFPAKDMPSTHITMAPPKVGLRSCMCRVPPLQLPRLRSSRVHHFLRIARGESLDGGRLCIQPESDVRAYHISDNEALYNTYPILFCNTLGIARNTTIFPQRSELILSGQHVRINDGIYHHIARATVYRYLSRYPYFLSTRFVALTP